MQHSPLPEIFVGAGLIFLLIVVVSALISIGLLIFWIWTIVDVAKHEPTDNDRLVWLLIIVLVGVIGSLIYLLVRRPQRMQQFGK